MAAPDSLRDTDQRKAFEAAWAKRPWITEEESDKDRAWRWWRAALSLPSQGTQDENPADIADQLDSIPGNNFNEAYALQTASEMLRQAASYSCPNRCERRERSC